MGRRQGHWFDKLRREWQMHRAFQTAMTYFKPELVVFLGDVFDEGKWAGDDEFQAYVKRFRSLFRVDPASTEVRVVIGNHDVGFHYAVTPFLENRFERAFDVASGTMHAYMTSAEHLTLFSPCLHTTCIQQHICPGLHSG